ncbi:hypothetical protein ACFQDD_00415 [Halorubrum pallidum]|uniref:Uncharacterized protein n=1 Tax=Halorubrum pallidum TaxID=1526114 RepID=A0ABD5SY47_9EURY
MAPTTAKLSDDDSDVSTEDAREALIDAYGTTHPCLGELSELHNGALSFLSLRDQATNHTADGSLPDDLDSDTRRQIETARTLLTRAKEGIEETARDRLNDPGESDDE